MNHKFRILCFVIFVAFLNTAVVLTQDEPKPTPKPLSVFIAESYIRFTALIMENGGCELPCWWGFDIGKTSEDEWWEFLSNQNLHFSLGDDTPRQRGTIGADIRFFSPSHVALWDEKTTLLFYFMEENILTGLQIDIGRPDRWFSEAKNLSFAGILTQQDAQPDIYFVSANSADLWVAVIYPDIDFSATFVFHNSAYTRDEEGNLTLCLTMRDTKQIIFNIENSDYPTPLFDRLQELIDAPTSSYIPIEEAPFFNSVTTDELINLITENDDTCFQKDKEE